MEPDGGHVVGVRGHAVPMVGSSSKKAKVAGEGEGAGGES